ncbi:MAG: hypothetical protein Q8S94_07955 [Pseudohongiella sp.]|nr:hypothetical protein [Pseudohongiella sp.]
MTVTPIDDMQEKLRFLCRITRKEIDLLLVTTDRLFPHAQRVSADTLVQWIADPTLSERLDAFVTRFSRLQDTVGDKLLPTLLSYLGEERGPAMDNLDKAERFGWLDSTDEWLAIRKLRNQMVHEYIEDRVLLSDALNVGVEYVPSMVRIAMNIVNEIERRLSS